MGVMEELWKEGLKEGQRRGQLKIAQSLLAIGKLTLEEIAECANLPLDEVRRIASEQSNSGPAQHMEDMTKWK